MDKEEKKIPPLVTLDSWLEPMQEELDARSRRFRYRLRDIEWDYGSLLQFARAHDHLGITEETNGWYYREWAPEARELYLFGDFNGWRRFTHPLKRNEFGVWEIFLPRDQYQETFRHGSGVKVLVVAPETVRERIPAYIRRVIQDPDTKNYTGQVWLPPTYNWENDQMEASALGPLFIYECHVGMAQEKEGVGTYREFTETILPRVKQMGYNAIQLMAVMEHPYYGSFGYHVSNFFAPSSRFGTPEELKDLVKEAHGLGIAVIMDIVHSHTVKNTLEGLNEFDGSTHQYFHEGSRGDHPQWDSKIFDYGKTEVLRFLLSNITYWLEEFHFDGFRFDGIGSMLYFHQGLSPITEIHQYFNEGVEWDAITYLQLANTLVRQVRPGAITIAEDVTGMPGLCYPVAGDGIGFDYRLGMGIPDYWIKILKEKKDEDWNIPEMWHVLNDRLHYVKTVAYCESHDQALVGDKTLAFRLMDKEMYSHMSVSDTHVVIDRGMALHKMIRLITLALGGQAYLTFMGNEMGHPEWIDFPREGNHWSYKYARRQWSLADNPDLKYQFLERFEKAMIDLAKKHSLLIDNFARSLHLDEGNKTIIFEKAGLVFLFNFHPTLSIPDYRFSVPQPGTYTLVLDSDAVDFGGHGRVTPDLHCFTRPDEGNGLHTLSVYNINRSVQVFLRTDE